MAKYSKVEIAVDADRARMQELSEKPTTLTAAEQEEAVKLILKTAASRDSLAFLA